MRRPFPFARILVLIREHDGHDACRLVGIARVLAAVLHRAVVVFDFPKELPAAQLKAAEIMLAVRIVVLVELIGPSPCREAHRRPPSS